MREISSQSRVDHSIPVRRTPKRRDSRITPYQSTARPSPRNLTPATSPISEFSLRDGQNSYQQFVGQSLDVDFLEFFDSQTLPAASAGLGPVIHQHGQSQTRWRDPAGIDYTLASNSQSYSRVLERNDVSPPANAPRSQASGSSLDIAWNGNFMTCNTGQEMNDFSGSDMGGSFGSFDSMLQATPDTGASSINGEYGFPGMDSTFGLPETALEGLELPDEYYHATGQILDPVSPEDLNTPLSPDGFTFEGDQFILPYTDVYSTQGAQWSSTTLTQPNQTLTPRVNSSSVVPHNPWNSQQAQLSGYQSNVNAGVVAFEPSRGITYETHLNGEELLQSRQHFFGPEALSPDCDTGSESWTAISYPNSYAASYHTSPHAHGSPSSHASSPLHVEVEHHGHLFSSDARIERPKASRGRQRNLTTQEKKSAREVREAKACWACHISKTKCSPCKPGKPCEQCARLVDKRRFCKFKCFNDPLEALHTFLVPEYNMGHFTLANVEAFVDRNATSWGTQSLFIRLSWGYRRLLEADVVALRLRSSSSEMGFSHMAITNGSDRPTLSRRESPALGIPLAAMTEMEKSYSLYICDIVQSDLRSFVSIAYDDQDCKLPEQLLSAVCSYYIHGLEADEENVLIRKALEMLVTSTIIERSLILDNDSIQRVQTHMQQQYPPDAVPRCAQRQIKLAFFTLQRKRIISVLTEWGNLMWTIHNSTNSDKKWAIGFSIFVMLTLVIDKTLGSAYYFCENRIAHHNFEEEAERNEFRKLVRLTQTELFERCKEIFHWKFKTRKAGKESCNPIRDGLVAFKGRAVDEGIAGFVRDLQGLVTDHEREIRAHTTFKLAPGAVELEAPYTDAGRLACIFLDDFLDRI